MLVRQVKWSVLTQVSDVPAGVDVGVPLVEGDQHGWSGHSPCHGAGVQVVPEEGNTVFRSFTAPLLDQNAEKLFTAEGSLG